MHLALQPQASKAFDQNFDITFFSVDPCSHARTWHLIRCNPVHMGSLYLGGGGGGEGKQTAPCYAAATPAALLFGQESENVKTLH